VKTPRDLSGQEFAKALRVIGYEKVRQDGSHIRMTTQLNGEHHVTVPNHRSLRVGTLNALLKLIATHHKITVEEVLTKLDL
jgi:predicted RNA binding protein YcfA (HicA-like mRNA interferase family)